MKSIVLLKCLQASFGLSIWQQISKEFFNKLYLTETETTTPSKSLTTNKKPNTDNTDDDDDDDGASTDENSMKSTNSKHYRTIALSRGLSKYGPWGYLILGMLLCGGALLVCVLWGK